METKTSFKKFAEDNDYTIYGDKEVIENIPLAGEGTLEVFTLGKYVSDDELEKEYTARGLVPAGPFIMVEYLKTSDKKYLGTHWKDAKGNWCFASFGLSFGERRVLVGRVGLGWRDFWWFAGLRKLSPESSDTLTPALETQPLILQHAIDMCKEAGYKVIKEM